jgi:hypothetical protein
MYRPSAHLKRQKLQSDCEAFLQFVRLPHQSSRVILLFMSISIMSLSLSHAIHVSIHNTATVQPYVVRRYP